MEAEYGERKTKGESAKKFLEKKENLSQAAEHKTIATDFPEEMDDNCLVCEDSNNQRSVPSLSYVCLRQLHCQFVDQSNQFNLFLPFFPIL